MQMLNGMRIRIVSDNCITKKVRRRTNKKKRIDKKWLKKYGYKEVPDHNRIISVLNDLCMTQKCYEKLKNILENDVKEGGMNE